MYKTSGFRQVKRKSALKKTGPHPSERHISKVMSGNRQKNTRPELVLRKELWRKGIRGYRLHLKSLPGTPDLAFTRKRLAVFVNGCFWHRCPNCKIPVPRTNTQFWKEKFERNVIRDTVKQHKLQEIGWTTVVVWECELKEDVALKVEQILDLLSSQ